MLQELDFSNTTFLIITIELFTNIVFFFGIGGILGLVMAFIPFRQKKIKEKLRLTFPFCTSGFLIIAISSFGYVAYLEKIKGIKIRPFIKYENVVIPSGLDCSSIKNGKFETENLFIERQGDKQIQIRKDTNEKKEFKVKWLSNCEYYLLPLDKPEEKIKVKIVNVTAENYNCYVSSYGKYAINYLIKIVKKVK